MLYGREAERAQIKRLIGGAQAGAGRALVVRGEAGIGKTALLDHAVRLADGMRVVQGAGYASEAGQPLAFLDMLLRPFRTLAQALPSAQAGALRAAFESAGADGEDPFLIRRAVLSLLCRLAADRPVLCVVDDAQWLDPASLDVLGFAARRLGIERIALLMATRDRDPFAISGLPELWPSRLTPAEAGEWLRDRETALAPPVVDRLVAESEGNPLALREFAASMTSVQRAGRFNPFSFHDGMRTVVGSVHEEFRAQVAELPALARTLLLVAAADDTRELARISVAARALGVRAADLGHAERAGLLQVTGTAVTFRHPLMRAVAYQYGTTAERRAAHRALAEAGGDERTELRAWQLAAATSGHQEEVAAELEQTAEWSAGWQAYAAYARAAGLTSDRRTRAHRLAVAARAASQAGLLDGAAELVAEARALAEDPLTRAELAQVSAAVEFERGSPRVACRTLIDGAALIEERDPVEALLMLAEAVRCGWHVADVCLLRQAEAALRAVPLPPGSALASLPPALSAVIASLPSGPSADEGLVRALVRAARHSLPVELSRRLMASSIGLAAFSGAGPDSAMLFVADCRASGMTGRLAYALQLLAHSQLGRGQFREATASAEEGLKVATATGQLHRAGFLKCILGWLAAVQGDQTRCVALVEEGTRYAETQGIKPTLALGGWALALLDLGYGRNEEALTRLERLAFTDSGMGTILRAPDQVEAAVRCGQPARALQPLHLLEEWVSYSDHAIASAVALRCRAIVSPADDAERYFAESIRLHQKLDYPYGQARTELAFGEWLRRARRRAEARPYLSAAADTFARLGAASWADRARAELDATGRTRGAGRTRGTAQARGTGHPGGTGHAGATGSAEGTGHAGSAGQARGTGEAGGTGQAGWTGRAGATGQAGGTGRAGATGQAGGTGHAGATGQARGTGHPGGTGLAGAAGQAGGTGEPGGAGQAGAPGQAGGAGQARGTGQAGGAGQARGTGQAGGAGQARGTGQARGAGQIGGTGHVGGVGREMGAGRDEGGGRDMGNGLTAGDRSSAQRAALGELTPQQLQIVRLAASGASNREIAAQLFLSPRTVGNHLYRAFPKLGIKIRAQLCELDLGELD